VQVVLQLRNPPPEKLRIDPQLNIGSDYNIYRDTVADGINFNSPNKDVNFF